MESTMSRAWARKRRRMAVRRRQRAIETTAKYILWGGMMVLGVAALIVGSWMLYVLMTI